MRVEVVDREIDIDGGYITEPAVEVRSQVEAYLAGERRTFDLTVSMPEGFTGDVMRSMLETPYGETKTYGEVAAELDSAAIAVGQACGRNPVPIVVPCHRIVGVDGIGGYSAEGGPALKEALLHLESVR